MDETNFAAAAAAAGLTTAAQSQQPPQPTQPPADDVYMGEDVSAYFQQAQAPSEQEAPVYADYGQPVAPQQETQQVTPQVPTDYAQSALSQQLLEQYGAAQRRAAELEAKLTAFEQTAKQKPAEPESPWYADFNVPEIPDDVKAKYAESLPVIESIARKQALALVQQLEERRLKPMQTQLQESVKPLHEQLNQYSQSSEAQLASLFQSEVRSRLPWLTEQVKASPQYANYYRQAIPGTGGLTREILLQQAEAQRNVNAVVDLLAGFQAEYKSTQPEQFVAPGRSNVGVANTDLSVGKGKVRGMRLSTLEKAYRDHSNGVITKGKLAEYQQAWDNAVMNGTAVVGG